MIVSASVVLIIVAGDCDRAGERGGQGAHTGETERAGVDCVKEEESARGFVEAGGRVANKCGATGRALFLFFHLVY